MAGAEAVAGAEPMHGSWLASCRVPCSELHSLERAGHGGMRGRSVTRREGDNTQGAGEQVLAFAVSFLGWCGADAQTFQKFRASGSSLRHPRSLLIAQFRLDVSPSAWGFPQGPDAH